VRSLAHREEQMANRKRNSPPEAGITAATTAASSSKRNRSRGNWVLALFALPFAGVGIGSLLLAVLPTLYDWTRMQSWQPVDATLVSAKLHTSRSKNSDTYSVTAHYRFELAGQQVHGSRVAINERSDNIGDFNQQLGARLERALREGKTVQAWVNPSDVSDSVIDRSLRWGLLAFWMVFVMVFGGFGVGMLAYVWHARKKDAVRRSEPEAEPWLARPEWAHNKIRSHKRLEVWVAWGFAAVWNLLALPAAIGGGPKMLRTENYAALGAVSVFVLVGLGLLVWAVRATLDARRYGEVYLQLDPFPGSIGGHFGATMPLKLPYQAGLHFDVTLSCVLHYQTRSAGKSGSESRESVVWQTDGVAQVAPHTEGVELSFRFSVPRGLPQSQEVDTEYHAWRAHIESADPALAFARTFDVPVYATGETSDGLAADAAQHPRVQQMRDAQVDEVSDLTPIPGGVRLYQPYGRLWRQNLIWLGMGGAFLVFGVMAGRMGAPALFPVVFGGVGGAMLLWGFYALCNSLRVQLDRDGLHTERRLLGLILTWNRAPARDIARLVVKESYSSQTGTRHVTFFRVQVELKNGKKIAIADSLRGREAADQLLASIASATGYRR
jgi:hypothetical protein